MLFPVNLLKYHESQRINYFLNDLLAVQEKMITFAKMIHSGSSLRDSLIFLVA